MPWELVFLIGAASVVRILFLHGGSGVRRLSSCLVRWVLLLLPVAPGGSAVRILCPSEDSGKVFCLNPPAWLGWGIRFVFRWAPLSSGLSSLRATTADFPFVGLLSWLLHDAAAVDFCWVAATVGDAGFGEIWSRKDEEVSARFRLQECWSLFYGHSFSASLLSVCLCDLLFESSYRLGLSLKLFLFFCCVDGCN